MKRHLLILAAMLICGTMQAQLVEGWLEIPTGTNENHFDVACLDKSTVIVCGENGNIIAKLHPDGTAAVLKVSEEDVM